MDLILSRSWVEHGEHKNTNEPMYVCQVRCPITRRGPFTHYFFTVDEVKRYQNRVMVQEALGIIKLLVSSRNMAYSKSTYPIPQHKWDTLAKLHYWILQIQKDDTIKNDPFKLAHAYLNKIEEALFVLKPAQTSSRYRSFMEKTQALRQWAQACSAKQ